MVNCKRGTPPVVTTFTASLKLTVKFRFWLCLYEPLFGAETLEITGAVTSIAVFDDRRGTSTLMLQAITVKKIINSFNKFKIQIPGII
jgi:hypothetical protein